MRSRNVRRRTRATLIFQICTGLAVLGLVLGLMKVSSSLGESLGEVSMLKKRLTELPPPVPAVAPVVKVDDAELKRLASELEVLRGELAKAGDALATAERAGEAKRQQLTTDFALVLAKMGADEEALVPLLNELPVAEQELLVKELEAIKAGNPSPPPTPPAPPATVEEEGEPDGGEDPVVPAPEPEPVVTDEQPEDPDDGESVEEEAPQFKEYTIRRGDTVSQIARRHGVETEELMELNGIVDARRIQIGQKLKIPE